MTAPDDDAMRRDWDARARHAMRLYVATWYAHSDETWAEGTRRDAAYLMEQLPAQLGPGQACVIPKGEWHKINVLEPGQLLHLTPGPNGDHRPLIR